MTDPLTVIEFQLRWLLDRAAVSDLILAFARAIDENDAASYADCFAEDGEVDLPHTKVKGQVAIRAMQHKRGNGAALHISANHQIKISGDSASVRACVIAAHVFDRDTPSDNARAGGWYDIKLVRGKEGWKFASVKLNIVWTTGDMVR